MAKTSTRFLPNFDVDLGRKLLILVVLFLIVSIWTDPEGTSQKVGSFLGDVGRFAAQLVHVIAEFVAGLGR